MPKQAGQHTSWVCPKQHLALCIKAACSRNKTRVKVASIVERAVPGAVLPPAAPSYEIAILAVQKRLWAGYHGVGIASQAIAGPASTEESTAATLIILNFVIRTSSWFWKRESLSLAATAGSTLSF